MKIWPFVLSTLDFARIHIIQRNVSESENGKRKMNEKYGSYEYESKHKTAQAPKKYQIISLLTIFVIRTIKTIDVCMYGGAFWIIIFHNSFQLPFWNRLAFLIAPSLPTHTNNFISTLITESVEWTDINFTFIYDQTDIWFSVFIIATHWYRIQSTIYALGTLVYSRALHITSLKFDGNSDTRRTINL